MARVNVWTWAGDECETKLLRQYEQTLASNQLALTMEGGLEPARYPFAARDQPQCRACVSCVATDGKICENSWYQAFLSIHTCTVDGVAEKVVVVCFPGWPPCASNQVHEAQLLRKLRNKDISLLNDRNIRVFRWADLPHLSGQVGLVKL
jgi:hypothetical protein